MLIIFFTFQNFTKICEISVIDTCICHLLVKTGGLYLKICLCDNVSRNPFLLRKLRKHDVTLTSFTEALPEIASFPSVWMCQVDGMEGTEIDNRLKYGEISGKIRGRGNKSPPPPPLQSVGDLRVVLIFAYYLHCALLLNEW